MVSLWGVSTRRAGFELLLLLLLSSLPARIYALEPFSPQLGPAEELDVRGITIGGIHDALTSGRATCRSVVSAFISRIEAFNPSINAVLALSPEALEVADALDARLASSSGNGTELRQRQPLFCVPVLLKDNFDAAKLATTAGCLALANNRPAGGDGPVVRALRRAGAVVLGKASMHELALEGISVSSLGGQVVNPYDRTRAPGGSSGGSGAAVAASLAVLATGTDTVNSLRSPASANGLVSFRPTRGLISRAGVIPVSYTHDAVGAMGRTVADVAAALTVMAGVAGRDGDARALDNATALAPADALGKDYVAESLLWKQRLRGLRIGVLDGFFNHTPSAETTPVNDAVSRALRLLESAGGVAIVNITDRVYDALDIAARLDVQRFEYREMLDSYLSRATGPGVPRSFHELYYPESNSARGKDFLVLPAQYEYISSASSSSTSDAAYHSRKRGIANLTNSLHATFASHNLDAIIYPEQKNLVVKIGSPSQAGRNGILAALTGFPVVAAPAGFSAHTGDDGENDAPAGVPIGIEILGLPWSEGKLLGIAHALADVLMEASVGGRVMPPFANASVETRAYTAVPEIVPNSGNIPAAYPLGTLA